MNTTAKALKLRDAMLSGETVKKKVPVKRAPKPAEKGRIFSLERACGIIAGELEIARFTVRRHVMNDFAKLVKVTQTEKSSRYTVDEAAVRTITEKLKKSSVSTRSTAPSPTRYIENTKAEAVNLDITYTLNQFVNVVSKRFNISPVSIQRTVSANADKLPGVLSYTMKEKTYYSITPQFARFFVNVIIPKLRKSGMPVSAMMNFVKA